MTETVRLPAGAPVIGNAVMLRKRRHRVLLRRGTPWGWEQKECIVHGHNYRNSYESAKERALRWARELNPGWVAYWDDAKELEVEGEKYEWIEKKVSKQP